MIGVGVITYNRLASLRRCIASIEQYTTYPIKLIIADDGSTDGTQVFLQQKGVKHISAPNRGVAVNKNRALGALSDCDPIFLIEDDARILKQGWEQAFIAAQQATGEQHISFSHDAHPKDTIREVPPYTVCYRFSSRGFFLFLTKLVLQKVGGFDLRFGKYGYEHCDYTYRAWRAGLIKGINPHVIQLEPYVKLEAVPSVMSSQDRNMWAAKNLSLYYKSISEADRGVIYRPIQA